MAAPVAKGKIRLMCFGAIGFGKKSELSFVPAKTNVDAPYYVGLLEETLVPFLEKHYPDDDYIFMEDGASAHHSPVSMKWKWENIAGILKVHQTWFFRLCCFDCVA